MCSPISLGHNLIPSAKPTAQIPHDDAAVIIDHKDRTIGLRPIGEDVRDLVVTIEDGFHCAQFGSGLFPRHGGCRPPKISDILSSG
jgi:hypothetical protein